MLPGGEIICLGGMTNFVSQARAYPKLRRVVSGTPSPSSLHGEWEGPLEAEAIDDYIKEAILCSDGPSAFSEKHLYKRLSDYRSRYRLTDSTVSAARTGGLAIIFPYDYTLEVYKDRTTQLFTGQFAGVCAVEVSQQNMNNANTRQTLVWDKHGLKFNTSLPDLIMSGGTTTGRRPFNSRDEYEGACTVVREIRRSRSEGPVWSDTSMWRKKMCGSGSGDQGRRGYQPDETCGDSESY